MKHRKKWLSSAANSVLTQAASLFILMFSLLSSAFAADRPRAPFKVLFSNDTTNITTCVSPHRPHGEKLTVEMFQASIDETAGIGIDVHMLQPGLFWVPWWKSEVLPLEKHHEWFKKHYGIESKNDYHDLSLAGNDLVQIFVKRCREKNLKPFISCRLNDGHHLEFVDDPKPWMGQCLTQFYVEHPEYRLGPDKNDWYQHVLNWAIPEVRDYKFAFIEEVAKKYDIDGLELDFMRHCAFFKEETPVPLRKQIMTDFIKRVRTLLNNTAEPGQHRWLCVRIPAYIEAHNTLGIDLPEMTRAGVDMINASCYYFTEHQTDLGQIGKMVPDTAVYLEMCHTTRVGKVVAKGYDNFTFRRTTDEQYYTGAHLAYARGAAGVSTFNFVYYRQHGNGERGSFSEPPFYVNKHLGDPPWLAEQPQHYVLAETWNNPKITRQLQKTELKDGQPKTITMDLAPPIGGWKKNGTLRIQSDNIIPDDVMVKAVLNGTELISTNQLDEPYPNPNPALCGPVETLRGWTVPVELLEDGINTFEFTLINGKSIRLVFTDLALP